MPPSGLICREITQIPFGLAKHQMLMVTHASPLDRIVARPTRWGG